MCLTGSAKFAFPAGMTKVPPVCLLFLALAGIVLPLRAGSNDLVAVSSTASEDYVRQKFGPGAPKRENYLFFQGKFFGGTTRDPNLEHAQFIDIVKILAENMVRQNYFPTKDPKAADLLIVVHWGTTTVYEDPNRQFNLENKNAELSKYNDAVAAAGSSDNFLANLPPDQSGVNMQLAISDLESGTQQAAAATNAQLLGFRQQLAKDQNQLTSSSSGLSDDEMALQLLLSEERYFVILMAYDYHTMKKGSRPQLLWSTRFSIRAPGNSFTGTLPVMGKVAADFFGHPIDGLKLEKPNAPRGKVEVGVPTVVGDGK
jgi:hypothetical protein